MFWGVVGLPLLTTVVPRSHPLENSFRIGNFFVTPLCPCSLTPKKLSQKPQRFFFFWAQFVVFIRFFGGWSRCSDSLQTAGGSAATNSAKSLLIAVFLCLHPNI